MFGSPNIAAYPEIGIAPVPSEAWFALQARVRFERKICVRIVGKGLEAYVPVTRQLRRWSDRQQRVEIPFFPGYVFVRADLSPADKLAILQTQGAYSFVSFGGMLATIPCHQIEDLRRIEQNNAPWSAYPFLTSGRRVRIRGGSLHGLEGIYVGERSGKLVVSIEPLQRSIALDLQGYELEML